MYAQDAVAAYNVAGPLGLGLNQAVQEIASAKGLKQGPPYWIGVDANQDWINPGFVLVSMMKRVDRGVYFATQLVVEGKFREVVSQNKGIVTLGIGTTISGIPITGISVSTLDDLSEFVQMGINAEELTGKKVLPMTPEEITAAVKSMRDALPSWIWDAEKDLETAIQNDPTLVPLAMTQEAVDQWRATLG
jgi:basic membrane protein A